MPLLMAGLVAACGTPAPAPPPSLGVAPARHAGAPRGTVIVNARLGGDAGDYAVQVGRWLTNAQFVSALKDALAAQGLYTVAAGEAADFALDVGVDRIESSVEVFGAGFKIDMTSVWRLVRARDGAAVLCEFVDGHGAAHGMGESVHGLALAGAARRVLADGVAMLARKVEPSCSLPLVALRRGLGTVQSAGYRRQQENWPLLRAGMSEAQVRQLLDPDGLIPAALPLDKTVYGDARNAGIVLGDRGAAYEYRFVESSNRLRSTRVWHSRTKGRLDQGRLAFDDAFVTDFWLRSEQGVCSAQPGLNLGSLGRDGQRFWSRAGCAEVSELNETLRTDVFTLSLRNGKLVHWEWLP